VQVDIDGFTSIYRLNVAYLAVDPTFPHHLNSFDNVPINYGQTLSDITVKSLSPTSYTNLINYTQQTAGRQYTKFSTPFDKNKILLYITSISIAASGKENTTFYPVDLRFFSKVLTEDTYNLSVSLSVNVSISKLQFSMVIFN
jgi:hypothetical protein